MTFFRFDICQFCNIRINKIIKGWDEFDEHIAMIDIFEANIDKITKSMNQHNPHFIILAAVEYTLCKKYEVQKLIFWVLFAPISALITIP